MRTAADFRTGHIERRYETVEPTKQRGGLLMAAVILGLIAAAVIFISPEVGRTRAAVVAFAFAVAAVLAVHYSRTPRRSIHR